MLRSALQGKGYTKGMVPTQQTIKEEADEVERALYDAEPVRDFWPTADFASMSCLMFNDINQTELLD
jgi:hypothetical protein